MTVFGAFPGYALHEIDLEKLRQCGKQVRMIDESVGNCRRGNCMPGHLDNERYPMTTFVGRPFRSREDSIGSMAESV